MSRKPLEQWEEALRGFPRAARGHPVVPNRVSPDAIHRLRGLGGISVEPGAPQRSHQSLVDAIRSLEQRRVETGDIWIWTTELENPVPAP